MAVRIDTAALDRILHTALRVSGVPGMALAVATTEEVYARGYGVKAVGGTDAVTPETLFLSASVTKPFTATAIALLADRGTLSWDEPVRRYLPEFRLADPVADSQVTLRDLITHRTGLASHDYLWYRSGYSRQEILRRMGSLTPTEPFRTKIQYSNLGYMVAGEVVRAVSGAASFEAFVQTELLLPLGMTRSNLSLAQTEADPDHTEPHRRLNGKIRQVAWEGFDTVSACGGLISCASEMVTWLQFHLNHGKTPEGKPLLSPAALRETYKPQIVIAASPGQLPVSCCLAWALQDYSGHPLLSHGGASDRFRAQITLAPNAGVGFCLLANLREASFNAIANAIRHVLLGLPPEDWVGTARVDRQKERQQEKDAETRRKAQRQNGKPSPLPLRDYTGRYACPAYGPLTVRTEKQGSRDRLHLAWNQYETGLRHQTFTTFVTTDQKERFETNEVAFVLKPTGEVQSLNLLGTTFTRLGPAEESKS